MEAVRLLLTAAGECGKLCPYIVVTSAPSGTGTAALRGRVNRGQRLTAMVSTSPQGVFFCNTSSRLASDASKLAWDACEDKMKAARFYLPPARRL